jgi:hypothetical protein
MCVGNAARHDQCSPTSTVPAVSLAEDPAMEDKRLCGDGKVAAIVVFYLLMKHFRNFVDIPQL